MREKWREAGAGERYARARWSSERRRRRDPSLVAGLLARHLPSREGALLLDAPCGAGRLRATLARRGRYVGLDVSAPMLAAARSEARADAAESAGELELVLGDVERLPFRDDSFDAVVCCRLLHHLVEREALARVLRELVRVSRGLVIASFWDAASLPAWRRRVFAARRPARRHARPRTELVAALAQAGAEAIDFRHSLRFVSRQAFVVARKRARA